MSALIESANRPLSFRDVAGISQALADDLARLPLTRGGFTVDDYLSLDGNYFVEYVDGCIQVLPMPTRTHQRLARQFVDALEIWAREHDPRADCMWAPFFVSLNPSKYREPDVCFLLGRNAHRGGESVWDGSDLVIEIVSESNRAHDVETKRHEYAANGIPEYWIVDPAARTVTVLTLAGTEYAEHGVFAAGDAATSVLLPGFAVDVRAMFDDAERRA